MSDESISSSLEASADEAPTPKVRRISNKNPKKAAKVAKVPKEKKPVEQEVPTEEFDSTPPAGDDASEENQGEAPGEAKRKNRRRRGKGKSSQKDEDSNSDTTPTSEETINLGEIDTQEEVQHHNQSAQQARESNPRQDHNHGGQGGRRDQQNQRPPQKQRSRPDPDKISKNAWKIFLAEVSEEGVALIGDNDARELSRRCFRLAEIFLEEEGRRN